MKITKLLLAGAMIIAATTTTMAQELNWGIKAGANYSTLTSDMEPDHIFGYHAGVLAEVALSPKFSIQPELLYSLEGAKAEQSYTEDDFFLATEEKIKLGYINLPIMVKYDVIPGLSLQAGPQLGYLINGKNEYEISSNFDELELNESGTEDIKDELKKISLGLNFGLGYDFQNNFFLQARYHLGLNDISDFEEDSEDMEGELDELKNRSFQFSLGYKF